jgi:hypothetical protein
MHAHPSSPTQSDRAAARAELRQALADPGYAFLASDAFSMTPHLWDALAALRPEWCDLPLDSYLADNGRYRYRRHGRFSYCPASRELEKLARTPYFQASYVNRFAGGVQRNFAPLSEATFANPFLHQIIRDSFDFFPLDEAEQARSWITDVHLVRVCATSDEAGKPTPEGIHCDGFRYVSFHLIERMDIRAVRAGFTTWTSI